MTMREVYVLMRDVGEYGDRDESPVLATLNKGEAEAWLAKARAFENDNCAPPWETRNALRMVRTYGEPTYRLVTVRLTMWRGDEQAPLLADIPRERVEALHAAVRKRMEQLEAAGIATHFASERDIFAACRSDLSEVAEALRLLLEVDP